MAGAELGRGRGVRAWPQGHGVVSGRGLVRSQRWTGGTKERVVQSGDVASLPI